MCKLLLLSHGGFAREVYNTASLIMGKPDNVDYITLPYGQDINAYQKQIEEKVLAAKDSGILILTDLFGGSPFMISSRVYDLFHDTIPMEIVTGMNMPMVLQVISSLKQCELPELKEMAVNYGKQGVVDFSSRLKSKS